MKPVPNSRYFQNDLSRYYKIIMTKGQSMITLITESIFSIITCDRIGFVSAGEPVFLFKILNMLFGFLYLICNL